MATKEAVAQLAHLPERVSVLETKVENINEKLVDLKGDVKNMHDCLDNTRDSVMGELDKMQNEYRTNSQRFFEHADRLHAEDVETHSKLAGRIGDLEKLKNKYTTYAMMILAFAAGTGWIGHMDLAKILKFVGL
jgi:chromosome segregation ATPase